MSQNDFVSKWLNFKISEKKNVEGSLEYVYTKKDSVKKKKIVEALIFWKYVISEMKFTQSETAWREREVILSDFFNHENKLLRIVAMLESMPTSVWEKVLWKYNIDFMSFESFLRRIDEDQIAAIEENLFDLQSEVVPRAFLTLYKLWSRITYAKLISEEYDYEARYGSKGAMSYNLLNLDFGFNAYPEGLTNDYKVVEISPLRFLSVKNHADDFVVNQGAGGKYWWLYKTARSNYVLNPDKEVKLNTHICPGFWYTLFIHFFFWVLSPLAMATSVGMMIEGYFSWAFWLNFIPGLFTPAWLLLAVLKYIFSKPCFGETNKRIKKFVDKHENTIGMIVVCCILVAVAIAILYGTWYAYVETGCCFSITERLMVISLVYLYLGYHFYHGISNSYSCDFSDFPWYFKVPIVGIVIPIMIKFFTMYGVGILSLLNKILLGFISIVMAIGYIGFISLLPVLLAISIAVFAQINDEKIEKFYVIFERLTIGLTVLLTIGLSGYIAFASRNIQEMNYISVSFFGVILLIVAFQMFIVMYNNPRKIDIRDLADDYNRNFLTGFESKWVMKNEWLSQMTRQEIDEKIKKIIDILGSLYVGNYFTYLKFLIPNITPEIYEIISVEENRLLIRNFDSEKKYETIFFLTLGLSLEEAIKEADEKIEQKRLRTLAWEMRKEKAKRIAKIIFFLFILIGLFFVKLVEYTKTLYRLYELFNERCPYISEKKVLKI